MEEGKVKSEEFVMSDKFFTLPFSFFTFISMT